MPSLRPAHLQSTVTAHFRLFYHPTPLHCANSVHSSKSRVERYKVEGISVPVILTISLSSQLGAAHPQRRQTGAVPAGLRSVRSLQGGRKGSSPRARSSRPEPRTGRTQPASQPALSITRSPPPHIDHLDARFSVSFSISWISCLLFLTFFLSGPQRRRTAGGAARGRARPAATSRQRRAPQAHSAAPGPAGGCGGGGGGNGGEGDSPSAR